ncbi:MAG: NUDIX domain-containing protein [Flavisolibacter sp.]
MRQSAGILLYKKKDNHLEFFLVHPGGPFWKQKDKGAWSVPKGEFPENEDPLEAAKREFEEETGTAVSGPFRPLNPVRQKGGKIIYGWALEGDIDAGSIVSNNFTMEWPYKSGKLQSFPEVDRAGWFNENEAREKINPAQAEWIEALVQTG